MKAIVTGTNGTVGPVLAEHLRQQGHEVVEWDRSRVSVDDAAAIRQFIEQTGPDWFFHVALGSGDWAVEIARTCAAQNIKLVFTSTVSVFASNQPAPLTPTTAPLADDDYGRYKRETEQRMQAVNPDLIIARLAWQIGDAPGSNNMVDYLDKMAREQGKVTVSTRWFPASAFLIDTATALLQLIENFPAGIYHLDANPGLSIYEIAVGLKALQGRNWEIIHGDTPEFDNRMVDDHLKLTPITERLGR